MSRATTKDPVPRMTRKRSTGWLIFAVTWKIVNSCCYRFSYYDLLHLFSCSIRFHLAKLPSLPGFISFLELSRAFWSFVWLQNIFYCRSKTKIWKANFPSFTISLVNLLSKMAVQYILTTIFALGIRFGLINTQFSMWCQNSVDFSNPIASWKRCK